MDDLTNRLSRLGRMIARASDASADPTSLPNARRRWLSAAAAQRRPRRLYAVALAFAAVVSLVIVVLVVRRSLATGPQGATSIAFTVGDDAPGAVGQWVAPEGQSPLALSFSEGTRVTVAQGARMRVVDSSARGATLLIERGALHAAIVHRDADTRWSVQAGPFVVRVTGTAFDASWDPATETFELRMLEGAVMVSGPRLPSDRLVIAGEQLVVSKTRMELRAGAAATPASAAPATSSAEPSSVTPPSSAAPSVAPPATTGSADAVHPAEATWKALARSGKFKDAMDAAEAAGFSAELARGSASDLLALADAARFAGRPARAKEALLALRRRFGARGNSAYLLGKIAADQLGSPGEAATWFEAYLQEEPGGALAEQALGRIIEIRKRDPGAARPAAERYLARYPNGAYAALARSIAGPR